MRITRLAIRNWRNFRDAEFEVAERLFLVGPNASGKSNLLDAIRFLRDLATEGGGFQHALTARGGLSRVRNLAARNFNHGRVAIRVSLGDDNNPTEWEYSLEFRSERSGRHRPIIESEVVQHNGRVLLERPESDDRRDAERLTQTALEQVNANAAFRPVVSFFAEVRYLHLVPQVIRDPDRRGSVVDDPHGGDFLQRIARTNPRTQAARLRRINEALRVAVPQLRELKLGKDEDGTPHLEATYEHWRKHGARQDERDFSDGTLRLIGLLWALQEGGAQSGPVLIEEPELSLHAGVVQVLPTLLYRASRTRGRQLFVSTHAPQILDDQGLGLNEVLLLEPGQEGTQARLASEIDDVVNEVQQLGLSVSESLIPKTGPEEPGQLALTAL